MNPLVIDLSGPFRYRVDRRETPETASARHPNPWPSPEGPAPPEALPTTDDNGWPEMQIPCNWQLGGLEDFSGSVWFRRRFAMPPLPGPEHRVWLRFDGVDYHCEVWLNGTYLGSHTGYFDPFEFEATGALRPAAENLLAVRVSAPMEPPGEVWPDRKVLIKGILNHHDCRPGSWDPARGQSLGTGGIWNRVFLQVTGPVRITHLQAAPRLLGPADEQGRPSGVALRVEVEVENLTGRPVAGTLALRLVPNNFEGEATEPEPLPVRVAAGRHGLQAVFQVKEPQLWWCWDQGRPNLYRLEAELQLLNPEPAAGQPIDAQAGTQSATAQTTVGLREIAVDEAGFWYLNGRRLFVRGTNVIPAQWLSEYTPDRIATDIHLLREAHVNAVRVHAHVNRREFYEACDQAGVLVWQDFALQWGYQESDAVRTEGVRQIRRMVRMLYNHPSICLWCCHNEPSANRLSLDLVLHDAVREMDATRPVVPSSDFREHVYPGWYHGDLHEFVALPGQPMPTEFGAQALPAVESLREMFTPEELWPPKWEAWAYRDFQFDQTFHVAGVELGDSIESFVRNSQAYQARLIKEAVERYRRAKYTPVAGLFQFMFMDGWPAITWSVVDYWRRPKEGYRALAEAYQPVLASVPVSRRRLPQGMALAGTEVWVINDLPRGFERATLAVTLEDGQGRVLLGSRVRIDIPPDSAQIAQRTGWSSQDWRIPEDAPPGRYTLHLRIFDVEGTEISHNTEPIEVVEAVAAHPMVF